MHSSFCSEFWSSRNISCGTFLKVLYCYESWGTFHSHQVFDTLRICLRDCLLRARTAVSCTASRPIINNQLSIRTEPQFPNWIDRVVTQHCGKDGELRYYYRVMVRSRTIFCRHWFEIFAPLPTYQFCQMYSCTSRIVQCNQGQQNIASILTVNPVDGQIAGENLFSPRLVRYLIEATHYDHAQIYLHILKQL